MNSVRDRHHTRRTSRTHGNQLCLESLEQRHLLTCDWICVAPDDFGTNQDSDWVTLDVLANDTFVDDYDGDRLISASSNGSRGGIVEIQDGGRFLRYLPARGVSGTEKLGYIVDGEHYGTATITINAPLAKDEYEIIQATGEHRLGVLSNDPFFDNYAGDRRISDVSATARGATVTVSADGQSVFYQAPSNIYGSDSFKYLVDDQFEAEVTVLVHRPVRDDFGHDIEQNSQDNRIDVLSNDFVSYNAGQETRVVDRVTAVQASDSGARVSISADGQAVIYTPPADHIGGDYFDYIANELYQARVHVNVTRPVRPDSYEVLQTSQDNRLAVLDNDFWSSAYTGARQITAVTQALNGTVTMDGDDLVYTPSGLFVGGDNFTYTVDDDLSATVYVNVQPLAQNDTYLFGIKPGSHSVTLNVLENDGFRQVPTYNGPANITSVAQPTEGATTSIVGNQIHVDVLDPKFTNFEFEYTVDDTFTARASVGYVSYLAGDSFVVQQNSTEDVITVLENDFNPSGWVTRRYGAYTGPRQITAVGETESGGTVEVGLDGQSVRYTPPENFLGHDRFQYEVDGIQYAYVNVTTIGFAREDRFRVDPQSQDNELRVLVNDRTDALGSRSVEVVEPSTHGATIEVSDDGQTLRYTPAPGFTGTDTLAYRLNNGSRAEVTVEVANQLTDLLPRFTDHAELEQFLFDDALVRYDSLFGQEVWMGFRETDFAGVDLAPEQRDHSETNVQVAGVDEGDIIEVDSDYLYVVTEDSLLILDAWPAEELHTASRTALEGTPLVEYLHDDRLTVISDTSVFTPNDDFELPMGGLAFDANAFSPGPFGTWDHSVTVTVFDLADRADPQIVQRTQFDGQYQDSRAINGFVYLVLQDAFYLPKPDLVCESADDGDEETCHYESRDVYTTRVQENIGALLDEALPHFSSYDAVGDFVRGGLLAEAQEVYRPTFATHGDILITTAVDMKADDFGPVSSVAIPVAEASQIYGSTDHLYVFGGSSFDNGDAATDVLKFSWNGEAGHIEFLSTGKFAGSFSSDFSLTGSSNSQFSIDEFDGRLRVATTSRNLTLGESAWQTANDLFVLRDNQGVIEGHSSLQDLSPGQTIQSVRFLGERAFVVTFQTSDPLLAIDLSGEQPELAGQLFIPGFSSYLQPIAEDFVVGMGRNTPDGRNGPAQISLFDISDLSNPVRVDQYTWDHWSQSEALTDHHAFGFFPAHSTLTIPIGSAHSVWTDTDDDGFRDTWVVHRSDDLSVLRYDLAGNTPTIDLVGNVPHGFPVQRSGYIDDRLYSVSTDDVIATPIVDPSQVLSAHEFGARLNDEAPAPDPGVTGEAAALATPTPLDGPVADIIEATKQHMANELGMARGQISVMAVDGNVYYETCGIDGTDDGHCTQTLTPGYGLVLNAGGPIFLYAATSDTDVVLVEADFAFAAAAPVSQNESAPLDVNNDDAVSPLDALLVINQLIKDAQPRKGLREIDPDYFDQRFYVDVDNNGVAAPLDALLVINKLSTREPAAAAIPQLLADAPTNTTKSAHDATFAEWVAVQTSNAPPVMIHWERLVVAKDRGPRPPRQSDVAPQTRDFAVGELIRELPRLRSM